MFVLEEDPRYRWPVRFLVPVDGQHEERQFTAEFRRLDAQAVQALLNPADGAPALTDAQLCERVCTGWFSDVQSPDGSAMEPTADNWQRLLRLSGMPAAVVRAWLDAERLVGEGN